MTSFLLRQAYDLSDPTYLEANKAGKIHPDQKAIFGSSLGRRLIKPIKAGSRNVSPLAVVVLILSVILFGGVKLSEAGLPQEYIYTGAAVLGIILLAGIGYGIYRWISKTKIEKEIKTGSLKQGTGRLAFGRRDYQVKVQGQHLTLPFGGAGTLSPGVEYRFYYLPESGTILSAEPLSPLDDQQAQKNYTEILAQANRFKLDVLEKNQQGILAAKQIPHLFQGVLIALLFIGVLGYFSLPTFQPYLERGNWSDMPTGMMILGLILGGIILYAAYLLISSFLDMVSMRVLSLEGVGHPFTRTSGSTEEDRSINYFYQIGERKFRVPQRAYAALLGGLKYRAYFTPYRKKLVNIEALESPLTETPSQTDIAARLKNFPGTRISRK